ncbi:phage tail protein [Xenorhabdus bovienii]|uniref:phage tail protein n=1 Tax=Xenorhabdus bovienii TaxID=40576 RepID=UPI003DA3846C
MSTKYFALLTRLGADKLANAAALGTKIEITHMAVGDGGGSLPTPHTTQAQLINERRRAAINVLSTDPKNTHQIIAEQVIPESEGGWWIREIGLFDKDGILIAVGNCAETYKPQLQEGSGRTQTLRMVLIVSSTDAVTLKIDPAVVLATREYVDSRVINSIKDHENSRRHPDATLKDKGFVILSSAVDSHSDTQAATPKAVKVAYDLANAARDNANGRVPATRKVNGKVLSSDISLGAKDVGAYTTGEVDYRVNEAKSLANTASQNAANANNNANTRLEKSKNGADIPNENEFVKNLGLADTVERAKNAASLTEWTPQIFNSDVYAKTIISGLPGADRTYLEVVNAVAMWQTYVGGRSYTLRHPAKSGTVAIIEELYKKSELYTVTESNNRFGYKNDAKLDQNGWWKCGDKGVIFQWGYTEKTLAESSETITFSTEFPHACFGGMASPSYPSTLASNSSAYFFNLNDGKRAIITCDQSAGAPDEGSYIFWWAVGI